MTDLTVCIPVYNGEQVIERAIRSIRTDEIDGRVEILVLDDCSTDRTVDVVRRLRHDVPEIRLIQGAENRGRPAARNLLLAEARGRYLTWLDADDEKLPGMIGAQWRRCAELAREPDSGLGGPAGTLVFTNYQWVRADGGAPVDVSLTSPADPMRALLDASFGAYLWLLMGPTSTFRQVGGFSEKLPRLQDLDFMIRLVEIGGRFERVDSDAVLCRYYKEDGGRDAAEVWRSWNGVWRTHRVHYLSYGREFAWRCRRHQLRVVRRYARANGRSTLERAAFLVEAAVLVRGSAERFGRRAVAWLFRRFTRSGS